MGGLEVSNKFLRCPICLEIKRFTIKPEYPESKLKMNCKCSEKEVNLYEYLKELKKKEDFKIKCAKCQTEDPKEPKYCYQCQKIYCIKCCDFHSQLSNLVADTQTENKNDVNTLIGHKIIGIDKVDYHCILHQTEKFIGFCKKCLLNYCSKCEQENLHKEHGVELYSSIMLDKKKKDLIKEGKKYSQVKIDYNHAVSKKIRKKIKNAENKKLIETLSKENEKINQRILELFELFQEIYDKTKHKNYSIIYNVVHNTDFNVDRLKFDKKKHEEEDAVALIEYLKTDFIMHNEESLKKAKEKKEKEKKQPKEHKEGENLIKEAFGTPLDGQLFDEKYKDSDDEEEKKGEGEEDEDKKEEIKKEGNKGEEKKEEKIEEKKEEKNEESKKEKKEREKKEKEEKEKKEKEDKERAKKEEKEKKEREKKEKEEKAKKEKEDKERAKKEEKEKKEREKKEKEEKAKKEKEEKAKKDKEEKAKKEKEEKAKKEKEEKAKKEKEEKEKAKKEKEDKKNKGKEKDKKNEKKDDKKDKGKADDKNKKPDKRPSQPLPISTGAVGKIGDKKAMFQQMMGGGGKIMGMGRPAPRGSAGLQPGEKPVQIEHTRNEGDTVDIINNIQVQKQVKKKPKKINFDAE